MLTTSYLGATDLKAVDLIEALPNTEVLIHLEDADPSPSIPALSP